MAPASGTLVKVIIAKLYVVSTMYFQGSRSGGVCPAPSLAERGGAYEYLRGIYGSLDHCDPCGRNSEFEK